MVCRTELLSRNEVWCVLKKDTFADCTILLAMLCNKLCVVYYLI